VPLEKFLELGVESRPRIFVLPASNA
jgi:hypothetical protein